MQDDELEALSWDGWPAPDEFLIELGRMNALWSGLETFLNMCVAKLAGYAEFNEVPFILVHHASMAQRVDMLGALCEHLVSTFPNLSSHKSAVAKLRQAQALRNDFAHNGIYFDPGTGRVSTAKASARGRIKTSVREVRVADLRRASVAIDEASRALYALVLNVELGPTWERPAA